MDPINIPGILILLVVLRGPPSPGLMPVTTHRPISASYRREMTSLWTPSLHPSTTIPHGPDRGVREGGGCLFPTAYL